MQSDKHQGQAGFFVDEDDEMRIYRSMLCLRFLGNTLGSTSNQSLTINQEELAAVFNTVADQIDLARGMFEHGDWYSSQDAVVDALRERQMEGHTGH